EHARERAQLVEVEPHPDRQALPLGEAALSVGAAVLLVAAAYPSATEGGVVGLREDERVLPRDARLVVIAVPDPRAELVRAELARVHAAMEGVPSVITPPALLAEAGSEDPGLPGGPRHSAISSPSWAISHPAPSTSARSSV